MERRRPSRELKNSEDVQDALIEDYFRYDDLSRMEPLRKTPVSSSVTIRNLLFGTIFSF
jgi:hypothetical protein